MINIQTRAPLLSVPHKHFSTSLQRFAAQSDHPYDKIDKKHEEVLEHEKIKPHPDEVSATSSVHEVFHEQGVEEPEKEEDVLADLKSDLVWFPCPASINDALMTGVVESCQRDILSGRGP